MWPPLVELLNSSELTIAPTGIHAHGVGVLLLIPTLLVVGYVAGRMKRRRR